MKYGIELILEENLFTIKGFELSEVFQTVILENGKKLRWHTSNQSIYIDSNPTNDTTASGYIYLMIPIRKYF